MAEPRTTERGRPGVAAASAYLLLVVAMLSWSGNMIIGRALAGTVPPLGLSLMRWSIAFVLVLPFAGAEIVAKRAVLGRHWRILLLLGLLGVTICNSLSYIGLQWTTALNGALVNSAGPMLTLLAAFAFNRERATPWQLAGILVSLAGVL
ncbi:MAG TPA: DMT family transporter, partial [Stellaceae bacterium]